MAGSGRILPQVSFIGSVVAAALLLSGCASSGGGSEGTNSPSPSAKTLTSSTLVGTWGSTDEQQPNLVFDDEGGVSGTDGCNRLIGSWSVEGDSVIFSDLASTLMACEGVDTWLGNAASAQLGDDDELQIFDEADTAIGTLERDD